VPEIAARIAPIDPADARERFERLSRIFADMIVTVDELSTHRCPYRDRLDQCTAGFGCRNQRRSEAAPSGKRCGGDERLDYRSAWETS
jgi:hypothetical protein